ncbi:alpha-glycosidase [Paenibacillus thermotolerans]|uniref:alpha-glycosidase n=1 Tax=Paenibacillus thermotolerans TaxID=3027807 RepID=UPI002367C0D8|nr:MULTISPECIES: alpha-glycosidase [unclassified Paenibacillus]
MLLEAVYHRPKLNWSFAYDEKTVVLRLRAKRGDLDGVEVLYGDKFQPFEQMKTASAEKLISDELFDYWEASVQPEFRRLAYGFRLLSGKKDIWYSEKGFHSERPKEHFGLFEFPFLHASELFKPPEWVKDAVFYQIFPERFANGDASNDPEGVLPWGGKPEWYNFFGGDLQGVLDHLDHLSELGVNAIYFTPIFQATTNHKYDTEDYLRVDKHFGDNELLKKLVDACHARGIRVMLDAVFNHAGATFAPFLDVKKKGAKSQYKDWFHVKKFPLKKKDGVPTYDAFAFEEHMPKLNTANPQVQEYLLGVARYWIEKVGIDGWRLDVANEVDHEFWRKFRQTVKAAKPDVYILGEMFHDAMMWLQGDQFDATMNYPFTGKALDFFARGDLDAREFADAIGRQIASYPRQVNEAMFNLLDSHDTPRLLTVCGGDKRLLKLAVLFQLTYIGAPCIYYGDEVGMAGEGDPDCRRCMVWDPAEQDQELLAFYKDAIALRKRHAALRCGSLRFLHAKKRSLVYERADAQERFVILMNRHKKPRTFELDFGEGNWRDALTGEIVAVGSGLEIELPEYGYLVLQSKA